MSGCSAWHARHASNLHLVAFKSACAGYSACGLKAAGHFCTPGPSTDSQNSPTPPTGNYCCVPGCSAWHARDASPPDQTLAA